jgi:hypothetical protein
MANIPDINVDVANTILIDTSVPPITVEAISQSPVVSVTNTSGTVSVTSAAAPDVNVTEINNVTIDTSVVSPLVDVNIIGMPGPQGPAGPAEVYVGSTTPTGPEILWIDTSA